MANAGIILKNRSTPNQFYSQDGPPWEAPEFQIVQVIWERFTLPVLNTLQELLAQYTLNSCIVKKTYFGWTQLSWGVFIFICGQYRGLFRFPDGSLQLILSRSQTLGSWLILELLQFPFHRLDLLLRHAKWSIDFCPIILSREWAWKSIFRKW